MKSFNEFRETQLEEGTVPAERNRPEMSASDKSKMGKVADLMAKEKAKKDEDLPFTPDKPHKPVAKAGKYGSAYSTVRHLARQGMKDVQKEEVEIEEEITPVQSAAARQKLKDIEKSGVKKSQDLYNKLTRIANAHPVKEEVEDLEELNKSTLGSYVKKATTQAVTAGLTGMAANAGHTPKANQPEPGSKAFAVMRKREAGVKKAVDKLTKEETEMSQMEHYLAAIAGNANFTSIEEKKLTPAEMKKREEIAQAMERENPGMDMGKKMAIATAQAKKVAEGADDWEPEKETNEPDDKDDKELKDKAKKNTEVLQKISKAFAKEGKEHTVPKTEKEKDLAALAEPKDKITHADVLKGRGVTKEEAEQVEEAKSCMKEENPTGIKIYHTTKDGKSTHGIVFTPHDARTYEKEVKQSGGKVTHRAVMYGKNEGEKVAVKEGVEMTEETLDEISNAMKSNYVKAAALDVARSGNTLGRAQLSGREGVAKIAGDTITKRLKGIDRATSKMNKEDLDLEEAMISYNDFMDKIAMHRKMGNKVVDDKYSDKHATYTSIDKEGVGRKVTHTASGQKMENLGKVNGDDDEAAEVKTEKRGRGRPAGTKSGARRHS